MTHLSGLRGAEGAVSLSGGVDAVAEDWDGRSPAEPIE